MERSETENRDELNESILPFLNPLSDLVTETSDNNMPADNIQITPEDIFQLLREQNERFTERWTEQAAAFSKVLESSLQASGGTSKYNSVKLPTFSGQFNEDVNEFLTNFDRAANFHNWNDLRKAQALPLHLKDNASIWFNTSPDLVDKAYPELSAALKAQFHSASDKWLLRQKLNDRKQLLTESVSEYAADIRRTCQRIDLPRSECVNYFVQGLKPEIKNYVVLQRPGTLEEAENHAKLKESVPEKRNDDRIDEILKAMAPLVKQAQTPTVAAYESYNNSQNPTRANRENPPISKDDIAQIVSQQIRQELRRTNQNQTNRTPQNRGRRSFDGRPICDYCNKVGHVAYACRQRLNRNHDPRIPTYNERRNYNSPPRYSGQSYRPTNQQHLN